MVVSNLKSKIFYGWWIVLVCALAHFYTAGTYFHGFTALFNPIVEEFHWSYALVSLAFTFRGFESGVMSPVVGIFADRFGPRRILVAGVAIISLGFLLFSRVNSLGSFYVTAIVVAFGFSLASPVVTMTAVAQWFRQRRTLAMGFLTAGMAAGGLLVPAVVWAIDQFTWRTALLIFGVGTGLLCLPVALVVKPPPEGKHAMEEGVASSGSRRQTVGLTAKQILRTKDFWLLSAAIMFSALAGSAIIAHLIPHLVNTGLPRQTAGFMAIILALANITGRLGFGWLGDILDKKLCFVIAVSAKAAGVLAFALASSVGQFVPTLIILGIGFGGAIPLRPALQTELFGLKAFGTVQGLLMISVTVGSMVAPLFAGYMFDLGGSYRLAFLILGGCTFMALPAILALHKSASAEA